jgi:drug/metabolite transporter (DMT)-like permease
MGTGAGWRRLRPGGTGKWLLAMGVVSIAVNGLGFAAMKRTTATNMAMLFRLDLVFVVLIGAAFGLERIGLWQWMLLPVMLAGLGLLVEVQDFAWTGQVVGDAMVIGSAFGLAVNAFIIRHILRSMDEEAVSLFNHGISALGFVGLAVIQSDLAQAGHLMSQPAAWAWIAALGTTAAVSLPLYYAALHRMAVWKLRAFMLTAPLFVAVIEWPFFGFGLKPLQCLGAAVILGGLLAMVLLEPRSPATATDEPLAVPTPSLRLPDQR